MQIWIADPVYPYRAEIEIHLADPTQVMRMRQAFAVDQILFEVRHLWSAPERGSNLRRFYEVDEYGDIPLGIFGLYETYCGLCIRRHVTLDCLTVQIC